MSDGIEQRKALQTIDCLDAEAREQAIEPALLGAEFRKVCSQLGELRRRETHLLRRIAFLEAETTHLKAERDDLVKRADEFQASTSWRVTRPLRWLANKLRIRRL
jgi:hypothetical protein